VTLTGLPGGRSVTGQQPATVQDSLIRIDGATQVIPGVDSFNPAGEAGNDTNYFIGDLNDDDPGGLIADYKITIDWGDGTSSSGVVSNDPSLPSSPYGV
jgi:hypothetical protein